MKKTNKQSNEKQKTIFIIIGALVGVFLIYNLFLSPYAQCVSGYKKLNGWQYKDANSRAKIHCKALGR